MADQQDGLEAYDQITLELGRITEVARLLGEEGTRAGTGRAADRMMYLSDALFQHVDKAKAASELIPKS